MFYDQYKGLRVLVTGHTGFKGSWLCAWLLELGAEVAGFSLDIPTQPSAFEALGLADKIRHQTGDVRDGKALAEAVRTFKPDLVFHLAAQSLVRPSYAEPALTFATNAGGTLNILEAIRQNPEVRALVCITSDKCYRNDEWVFGYRESDHLGGEDPYSASKACAEIIAHSYFKSFFKKGTRMATVRAGNVIGGGDWALDRIVPDCARAFARKEAVTIRSPKATRPWQHVLEPLSGYLCLGARLLLAENAENGLTLNHEAFNFGPPADVNADVATVATALTAYWPGFTVNYDDSGQKGKKESTLLKLCCDKALAHLHWKAVLPFEDTIRFTAEWYRFFYSGDTAAAKTSERLDMYGFTAGQIADYTAKAAAGGLAWAR